MSDNVEAIPTIEQRRLEKINEVQAALQRLAHPRFEKLTNRGNMEKMMQTEIELLQKSPPAKLENHLVTCNYAFYKSIIDEIETMGNASAVCMNFERERVLISVDIVANEPHVWIKVVNRSAKTILIEYRDGKRSGDIIEQIKQHQYVSRRFNKPLIRVIFKNGILREMAEKLTRHGIHVVGELVEKEDPTLIGEWNEFMIEKLNEDDPSWKEEEEESPSSSNSKTRITIRLTGGHKDKCFDRIPMGPETHVDELTGKIQSLTQIPTDFQHITHNEKRLPLNEFPLHDVQHGDELVVRHNLLDNWTIYGKLIDEIRKMTSSGMTTGRRKIALQAQSQLSPLFSSNFFQVYPKYAIEELNISKSINFLIHNTRKYFKRSVLAYFQSLFVNQKVELKEKSEDVAGTHLGVFVVIDNIPIFYAKTQGNIPGSKEEMDFLHRPTVDLLEIYVYYLLKIIGVGSPEIHVIPDKSNSDLVFIATKLIDGFVTASGISTAKITRTPATSGTEKIVITSEMKVQMRILASMLSLSDLQTNKGNHGVAHVQTSGVPRDGEEHSAYELRIVDFGVNLGYIDTPPNILNSSADEPSLRKYFEEWNFFENIFRAKEEMEANPTLKNNKNVNQKRFDRYFKRLEIARKKFLKD